MTAPVPVQGEEVDERLWGAQDEKEGPDTTTDDKQKPIQARCSLCMCIQLQLQAYSQCRVVACMTH